MFVRVPRSEQTRLGGRRHARCRSDAGVRRLALWPRSLAGQMALLVAIALFVAQAINFGLLLHERQRFRFEQVTAPAITRMTDAIERARTRPDLTFDRGRVRFEQIGRAHV